MGKDIVDQLFDEAYEVREIERDCLDRRQSNRASLRSLRDTGKLSADQEAELEELYPTIRRPRRSRVA